MRCEHLRQPLMRAVSLCRHHDAGCVLVQPVNDAGAHHPANAGQAVAAMRQQSIDQRPVRLAGPRMHHKPCRLVEDNQMVILKQDVQRDILPLWRRIADRWQHEPIAGPGAHRCRRVGHSCAVLEYGAILNERLDPRARQRGVQFGRLFGLRCQKAVESPAIHILGRCDDDVGGLVTGHGAPA